MKEYKIVFWKRALTSKDDFVVDTNDFITGAIIRETQENSSQIFHVKLTDIGLDSKYGEFEIVRKDGFWQTTDVDGAELNSLKRDIIMNLQF